jgi:hypothetical protein
MRILRQGDVLLVEVETMPTVMTEISELGDIILAHGEATGHAHRIVNPAQKAKLWDSGAERLLQAMETVALTHEEHDGIEIAPGMYRIVIQTEYSPTSLRRVKD